MAATIPPPIEVRLDELLRERGMTLTELSDRIDRIAAAGMKFTRG